MWNKALLLLSLQLFVCFVSRFYILPGFLFLVYCLCAG